MASTPTGNDANWTGYLIPDVDQVRQAADAFGKMAGLDQLPESSRETTEPYSSIELKTA